MPLAFSQALEDYCVIFIATLLEFLVKNLKDCTLYGEEKSQGANRLIFAIDPKLELDAETLVLHSAPKFLCFVVYFHKKF